ncbi:hypothetical protein [Streptomyces sp. NPDC059916]|uniref:hypothetical protein n=1 Tax=Streptomyces sp. NPDC059916 TaxID=3347001 RepID=UPI00369B013E
MTDLLARIERLEKTLATATPAPLPGQEVIAVATIRHHAYEGAGGPCEAELFGTVCRAHRDDHELV